MQQRTKAAESGSSLRACSSFEVGQTVRYWNHVTGTNLGTLSIAAIGCRSITARNAGGREFRFAPDGKATWSCNLSILPTGGR